MWQHRILLGVCVGIIVLGGSVTLATMGLTKDCNPAREVPARQPDPCQGTSWAAAVPGTCIGPDLVGYLCRQDLVRPMTLSQYEWYQDNNTGGCLSKKTDQTQTVNIGDCVIYQ